MNFVLPDRCAGMVDRLRAFVRAAGFDPEQIIDICSFGETAELRDSLAQLAVSGPKRATTSLLRDYRSSAVRMPVIGDLFVIVNSQCAPRALARVTRVDVKRFDAVDADDAWDEGEGDRSLAYWRKAHRDYFLGEAAREEFTFREDDEVVFCRFEVL